jgi:hypothetical protein
VEAFASGAVKRTGDFGTDLQAAYAHAQTMEAVYDSHHGSDQDSDASEYVSNETETLPTENFAPEQPVETPTSLQMPQAWGKSQEAIWNGLTPDAQRYVAQRELEAQRRISELGHLAKHGDVGQTFESYKAQGLVPHGEDGQPLTTRPPMNERRPSSPSSTHCGSSKNMLHVNSGCRVRSTSLPMANRTGHRLRMKSLLRFLCCVL